MKFLIPTLLVLALIVALTWLKNTPEFEPAVTSLALLASLLSVYFDRILAENERRKEILIAVAHELNMNKGVVQDFKNINTPEKINSFHVYPRFYNTTLTAAISSGFFTGSRDKKLCALLNLWNQRSNDFNNRLSTSEAVVMLDEAKATSFNTMIFEGKSARLAFEALNKLGDCVFDEYSQETKIDRNTVLFGT